MPLISEDLDLQSFWKSFDQLSKLELYEVLSFRQSIFVVEQKSWYQDADGLDEISEHLLLKKDGHLVAYLRLTPPGIKYKTPSIGRIAVIDSLRGSQTINYSNPSYGWCFVLDSRRS